MKLTEIGREIHENAVAHGWWDVAPKQCETFDLIHQEWSEALEEYRCGRAMVWYRCDAYKGEACQGIVCDEYPCAEAQKHPEGIAIELIDGCIRIIDYMEANGITPASVCPKMIPRQPWEVPELISNLHRMTVRAYDSTDTKRRLIHILAEVFGWLIAEGFEPEDLMRKKMAYNRTRPYRHGGKVI